MHHSQRSAETSGDRANPESLPLATEVPDTTGAGSAQVLRHYPKAPAAGYRPFPREAMEGSVVERFEEQVARTPDKTAVCTPSTLWSYAELNTSANRVAQGILAANGAERTPVAILMDQEGPAIPSLLGVLKTGRPYVFLDPNDPPTRWESILTQTATDTLITTGHTAAQIKPSMTSCRLLTYENLDAGDNAQNPEIEVGPDHLAAIFFTSGSTGEPKGVARDHRQILHSTWFNTNSYFITPDDRHSLLYFPGFGASVFGIFDTLLNGATLCTLSPRRLTPSGIVTWLRAEGITCFSPPIGILRNFFEAIPPGMSFPDLRQLTLAGQALYGSDVLKFQSCFGDNTVLCFMLAMTEAGIVTHCYLDHTTEAGDGPIPAGFPVTYKEITILDDTGQPVEPGRTGRIAITSAYISSGYWQNETLTRACFHQDAEDSHRTTFQTSDRGRFRPDGCLELFGREDFVVKVRGYRVDLNAVEAVLNKHPSVHDAVVVAGQTNGHEPALAAYIVTRPGTSPSLAELRTFVSSKLPAYMVPKYIQFLEEIPLTSRGKVNRYALPTPGRLRPELTTAYVAPRNETEARIAEIWSDLLEVDNVGIEDDFFELGGDSLHAMRMAMSVELALHHPVSEDFFRSPTIENLARMVTEEPRGVHSDRADSDHGNSGHRTKATPFSLRGMKRIFSDGPVWGGNVLPYGAGIHLHRMLVAQPVVRRYFSARLALLREWAGKLGVAADVKELETIALLANTWKSWRAQSLSHPDAAGRWLNISDPDHYLQGSSGSSAGVVLAAPHAGSLSLPILKICQRSGRETASVTNAPWLGSNDGSEAWEQRQTRARSEMVWKAQQVLLRGGVVVVAADGLNGRQVVEVDFWGQRRPFRVGAAELAVATGATFVPVYFGLDAEGRVQVDVTSALATEGATPQERVTELTRRYGEDYAARWPQFFASMIWKHLEYDLRPSSEDTHLA